MTPGVAAVDATVPKSHYDLVIQGAWVELWRGCFGVSHNLRYGKNAFGLCNSMRSGLYLFIARSDIPSDIQHNK